MNTTNHKPTHSEPDLLAFFHTRAPYKSDHIYHYTSLDTMSCFLREDADFLCSDYKALKDQTEYNYGLGQCCSFMAEHGYCPSEYDAFIADITKYVNPWTMSFSSARDSRRLWNEYAPNGVSIGFKTCDVGQIAMSITTQASPSTCMLFLAPCFYHKTDITSVLDYAFSVYIPFLAQQRINSRVDKAQIRKCFLNKALHGLSQDAEETRVLSCIFITLSVLASIFKDESNYAHEQEYRLVLAPKPGGKPLYLKKTGTRDMAITGVGPYLRSKGLNLCSVFQEIVVSPNDHDSKLLTSVSSMMDKLPLTLPILGSTSGSALIS